MHSLVREVEEQALLRVVRLDDVHGTPGKEVGAVRADFVKQWRRTVRAASRARVEAQIEHASRIVLKVALATSQIAQPRIKTSKRGRVVPFPEAQVPEEEAEEEKESEEEVGGVEQQEKHM